jgi:hypothetical protein
MSTQAPSVPPRGKLLLRDLIIKPEVVKRLAGELQVSDAYLDQLSRYVELLVLRSADRCRKNQRTRLNEADV